jgi:general secretion pathway protein D
LSGTEGWDGKVSADYELMPLNPLIPKRDQTPKAAPQGFTKVDSPSSGITTYPLNR